MSLAIGGIFSFLAAGSELVVPSSSSEFSSSSSLSSVGALALGLEMNWHGKYLMSKSRP